MDSNIQYYCSYCKYPLNPDRKTCNNCVEQKRTTNSDIIFIDTSLPQSDPCYQQSNQSNQQDPSFVPDVSIPSIPTISFQSNYGINEPIHNGNLSLTQINVGSMATPRLQSSPMNNDSLTNDLYQLQLMRIRLEQARVAQDLQRPMQNCCADCYKSCYNCNCINDCFNSCNMCVQSANNCVRNSCDCYNYCFNCCNKNCYNCDWTNNCLNNCSNYLSNNCNCCAYCNNCISNMNCCKCCVNCKHHVSNMECELFNEIEICAQNCTNCVQSECNCDNCNCHNCNCDCGGGDCNCNNCNCSNC